MDIETDITTNAGRRAWRTLVAEPKATLLCTDFDGVLSPIVRDPDSAWASEETVQALARLGRRIGKVAVVTGRMARKAVQLGRLDERPGLDDMSVLGLYGFERWDAATGAYDEPNAPEGVAAAMPPTTWVTMYGRTAAASIRLAAKQPRVTAGLKCPPDK